MSEPLKGISNAFRAGENLLSGKLFKSVQIVQDWQMFNQKVVVENYSQQKGPLDANEFKTSPFSVAVHNFKVH